MGWDYKELYLVAECIVSFALLFYGYKTGSTEIMIGASYLAWRVLWELNRCEEE